MQKIITIDDLKEIINQLGINNFFSQLITELKKDFSRWQDFNKTPRMASHFPHGVIELMPIHDQDFYSFKYVNGHPKNPEQKTLTVVAMGVLAEVATGYPLIISEMTLLTAFRTAATAAIASSYLAKKNSKTVGIIGTGSQSEFLILAHQVALGIEKVKFFDIDPKAMKKFTHNLANTGLIFEQCDSALETIQDVDIIITAVAAKEQIHVIKDSWVKPGLHIAGMGGDCPGKTELDPAILQRSKIVVEYLPQTALEGEIQNLPIPSVYAELWELTSGKKPGRENDQEITLYDCVGFALEDFSALKLVHRLAKELRIGHQLDLIPDLEDPKNLFEIIAKVGLKV